MQPLKGEGGLHPAKGPQALKAPNCTVLTRGSKTMLDLLQQCKTGVWPSAQGLGDYNTGMHGTLKKSGMRTGTVNNSPLCAPHALSGLSLVTGRHAALPEARGEVRVGSPGAPGPHPHGRALPPCRWCAALWSTPGSPAIPRLPRMARSHAPTRHAPERFIAQGGLAWSASWRQPRPRTRRPATAAARPARCWA